MEYRTLGNTGLLVSRLCLGTMTFGHGAGLYQAIGHVNQQGVEEFVRVALDAGVNFFDTADVYQDGHSEMLLAQALEKFDIRRKEVVIATKVYSRAGDGRNDIGASRGHILDSIDAQLDDNLAAADLKLTPDEIKQLDDASALPLEYPGWMVEWQSHGRVDPAAGQVVEDLPGAGR